MDNAYTVNGNLGPTKFAINGLDPAMLEALQTDVLRNVLPSPEQATSPGNPSSCVPQLSADQRWPTQVKLLLTVEPMYDYQRFHPPPESYASQFLNIVKSKTAKFSEMPVSPPSSPEETTSSKSLQSSSRTPAASNTTQLVVQYAVCQNTGKIINWNADNVPCLATPNQTGPLCDTCCNTIASRKIIEPEIPIVASSPNGHQNVDDTRNSDHHQRKRMLMVSHIPVVHNPRISLATYPVSGSQQQIEGQQKATGPEFSDHTKMMAEILKSLQSKQSTSLAVNGSQNLQHTSEVIPPNLGSMPSTTMRNIPFQVSQDQPNTSAAPVNLLHTHVLKHSVQQAKAQRVENILTKIQKAGSKTSATTSTSVSTPTVSQKPAQGDDSQATQSHILQMLLNSPKKVFLGHSPSLAENPRPPPPPSIFPPRSVYPGNGLPHQRSVSLSASQARRHPRLEMVDPDINNLFNSIDPELLQNLMQITTIFGPRDQVETKEEESDVPSKRPRLENQIVSKTSSNEVCSTSTLAQTNSPVPQTTSPCTNTMHSTSRILKRATSEPPHGPHASKVPKPFAPKIKFTKHQLPEVPTKKTEPGVQGAPPQLLQDPKNRETSNIPEKPSATNINSETESSTITDSHQPELNNSSEVSQVSEQAPCPPPNPVLQSAPPTRTLNAILSDNRIPISRLSGVPYPVSSIRRGRPRARRSADQGGAIHGAMTVKSVITQLMRSHGSLDIPNVREHYNFNAIEGPRARQNERVQNASVSSTHGSSSSQHGTNAHSQSDSQPSTSSGAPNNRDQSRLLVGQNDLQNKVSKLQNPVSSEALTGIDERTTGKRNRQLIVSETQMPGSPAESMRTQHPVDSVVNQTMQEPTEETELAEMLIDFKNGNHQRMKTPDLPSHASTSDVNLKDKSRKVPANPKSTSQPDSQLQSSIEPHLNDTSGQNGSTETRAIRGHEKSNEDDKITSSISSVVSAMQTKTLVTERSSNRERKNKQLNTGPRPSSSSKAVTDRKNVEQSPGRPEFVTTLPPQLSSSKNKNDSVQDEKNRSLPQSSCTSSQSSNHKVQDEKKDQYAKVMSLLEAYTVESNNDPSLKNETQSKAAKPGTPAVPDHVVSDQVPDGRNLRNPKVHQAYSSETVVTKHLNKLQPKRQLNPRFFPASVRRKLHHASSSSTASNHLAQQMKTLKLIREAGAALANSAGQERVLWYKSRPKGRCPRPTDQDQSPSTSNSKEVAQKKETHHSPIVSPPATSSSTQILNGRTNQNNKNETNLPPNIQTASSSGKPADKSDPMNPPLLINSQPSTSSKVSDQKDRDNQDRPLTIHEALTNLLSSGRTPNNNTISKNTTNSQPQKNARQQDPKVQLDRKGSPPANTRNTASHQNSECSDKVKSDVHQSITPSRNSKEPAPDAPVFSKRPPAGRETSPNEKQKPPHKNVQPSRSPKVVGPCRQPNNEKEAPNGQPKHLFSVVAHKTVVPKNIKHLVLCKTPEANTSPKVATVRDHVLKTQPSKIRNVERDNKNLQVHRPKEVGSSSKASNIVERMKAEQARRNMIHQTARPQQTSMGSSRVVQLRHNPQMCKESGPESNGQDHINRIESRNRKLLLPVQKVTVVRGILPPHTSRYEVRDPLLSHPSSKHHLIRGALHPDQRNGALNLQIPKVPVASPTNPMPSNSEKYPYFKNPRLRQAVTGATLPNKSEPVKNAVKNEEHQLDPEVEIMSTSEPVKVISKRGATPLHRKRTRPPQSKNTRHQDDDVLGNLGLIANMKSFWQMPQLDSTDEVMDQEIKEEVSDNEEGWPEVKKPKLDERQS